MKMNQKSESTQNISTQNNRLKRWVRHFIFYMSLLLVVVIIMKVSLNNDPPGKIVDESDALIEDESVSSGWHAFQDSKTGLYGFMDDDEVVIDAKYEQAWDFYGGRAIVKVKPKEDELTLGVLAEGVYGLIDPRGEYVIQPNGYIVRVDTWRYLVTDKLEFWTGYGLNGDAVVKYKLVNGDGEVQGQDGFYYAYPVEENLFIANNGIKSYFINRDGVPVKKYTEFYFPVKASRDGDQIVVVPMDDTDERMKWIIPYEGGEIETIKKSSDLDRGVTYQTDILSTYIGSSIFYPQLSLDNLYVQSKLNKSLFETAKEYIGNTLFGEEAVVDLATVDHIDAVINYDYELSQVGNLLNYEMKGYFYGFGAAHPNPYWETLYYDLGTGESLKLETLFRSDVDWKRVIANFADAQFINDKEIQLYLDANAPTEERIEALTNGQFSVTFEKDLMQIHYHIYEIAPYAAGFPTCEIPLSTLDQYFDKEGQFYKALQHK